MTGSIETGHLQDELPDLEGQGGTRMPSVYPKGERILLPHDFQMPNFLLLNPKARPAYDGQMKFGAERALTTSISHHLQVILWRSNEQSNDH